MHFKGALYSRASSQAGRSCTVIVSAKKTGTDLA